MQYDTEAEACYLQVSARHLDDRVMVDVDDYGQPVGGESLWGRDHVPPRRRHWWSSLPLLGAQLLPEALLAA